MPHDWLLVAGLLAVGWLAVAAAGQDAMIDKSVLDALNTPTGIAVVLLLILAAGTRGMWVFKSQLDDWKLANRELKDENKELRADLKEQTEIALRSMRLMEWQAGLIKGVPDMDAYRQHVLQGVPDLPPMVSER